MKVQLFFRTGNIGLLLVCLILCFGRGLFSQNPDLRWTSVSGSASGDILLRLSNIKPLPGKNLRERYHVFWDFGDGTFWTDTLTQSQTINYSVTHSYRQMGYIPSDGIFHARVELTPTYTPDDDDSILLLYATTDDDPQGPLPSSVALSNDPRSNRNLYGRSIRADRSRNPKIGEGTTFMVTYLVDTLNCAIADNGGILDIRYWEGLVLDSSLLEASMPSRVEVYHGEQVIIDQQPTFGDVEIHIPRQPSQGGLQREVILNFFTPIETEVQESSIVFFLNDSLGNSCSTGTQELYENLNILGKKDPYDPNFKTVDKDTIQGDNPQWLFYSIQFQNTGKSSTDSITIIDQLDPRLDISTFTVLDVQMGYEWIGYPIMDGKSSIPYPAFPRDTFSFTYNISDNGNQIIWKLTNSGRLRGTGEPNFRIDFVEKETIAYINYKIQTKYFEESNVAIQNTAHVYFDKEPVVSTRPVYTYKACCCCQERTIGDSLTVDLLQYVDSSYLIVPHDSIYKVSLTSDTTDFHRKPFLSITNGGIATYIAKPSYHGFDVLDFGICYTDNMGTVICDTFQVMICIDISPDLFACSSDFGVGIQDDIQLDSKIFSIGPNPFNTSLHIYPSTPSEPIRLAELYNLQGLQVLKQVFSSREAVELQTPNLPSGVYLLRINQKKTFKVIKQ